MHTHTHIYTQTDRKIGTKMVRKMEREGAIESACGKGSNNLQRWKLHFIWKLQNTRCQRHRMRKRVKMKTKTLNGYVENYDENAFRHWSSLLNCNSKHASECNFVSVYVRDKERECVMLCTCVCVCPADCLFACIKCLAFRQLQL